MPAAPRAAEAEAQYSPDGAAGAAGGRDGAVAVPHGARAGGADSGRRRASARAAELARLRFEGGVADFLQVLDAERTQLDAEDQLAQAHTDAATSYAALYKALGGELPAKAAGGSESQPSVPERPHPHPERPHPHPERSEGPCPKRGRRSGKVPRFARDEQRVKPQSLAVP